MDRHHRPGARCQGSCGSRYVDEQRILVHVDQHGRGTSPDHGLGCRDEGVGGQDHLVARSDIQRSDGELHRVCAVGDANAVRGTRERGVLVLERAHVGAPDECSRGEDAVDVRPQVVGDLRLLGNKVDQGDCGIHGVLRSRLTSTSVLACAVGLSPEAPAGASSSQCRSCAARASHVCRAARARRCSRSGPEAG